MVIRPRPIGHPLYLSGGVNTIVGANLLLMRIRGSCLTDSMPRSYLSTVKILLDDSEPFLANTHPAPFPLYKGLSRDWGGCRPLFCNFGSTTIRWIWKTADLLTLCSEYYCTKGPMCAQIDRFCAIYLAVCAKSRNFAAANPKSPPRWWRNCKGWIFTLLIYYGFKDCCSGQASARHP